MLLLSAGLLTLKRITQEHLKWEFILLAFAWQMTNVPVINMYSTIGFAFLADGPDTFYDELAPCRAPPGKGLLYLDFWRPSSYIAQCHDLYRKR